ncbi:SDR family oxidoreductase [Propionivibrio sp.]|uniref:SDR family oxidoreductase n=2 Tax=Propionivibrio sp. TaxID=2212460 RepID=UPI0025F8108B|nr:SDR family oxidoreductase [Propionivibrio sp.]MBK7355498.1 SDR family oxidoreductase [Propionivibrio sp.]
MNGPTYQVLVTGANRGLGLEFVSQYASAGCQVIACCRDPLKATKLSALVASSAGKISMHALDVSDFSQIERLASELQGQAIDVLINNAGIYPRGSFGSIDYAEWHKAFLINSMAPMKIVECFVDHVAASRLRKIVTLSSKMGSIADNDGGGSALYRTSKSAVNMVMKNLAIELKSRGFAVATLHPGWVKTDMGGANALISVQQSVAGMRTVIEQLSTDNTGRFIAFDGQEIPW